MSLTKREFVDSLTRHGILPNAEVTTLLSELTTGTDAEQDAESLVRRLVAEGKLTKFQAVNLYQGRGKGLLFGEYVVLDKLGAGGMGKVYLARHQTTKQKVAIKVLPPHVSESPKIVQRFFREVQVASKLSHPNIVATYDSGESRGLNYMVMEFVEGVDLSGYIEKHGTLSVRHAVDVVMQAARGLEYAHGLGIVHRDIKPANLLIDRKGAVKILDMGLARVYRPDPDDEGAPQIVLTVEGEVMGTADYMAPEQSQDTHSADHRADIYALGCTLYRLLTGNPPYSGETQVMKIMAHHDRPIPPLRAERADVPESLDALYRRMLAKKPEDRPQSVTEILAELEPIAASL